MKLLCIKDSKPPMPLIKKGWKYNATDVRTYLQLMEWAANQGPIIYSKAQTMRKDGIWYELEETGPDNWYHETHFDELPAQMIMVKEGQRGEPKKIVFFEE